MKHALALVFLAPAVGAVGQLPNGSTAQDFTLTDYYGTTHNLYTYLNDGKTVFLEFFAAHCPTCWGYHQTHRLKNIHDLYGPSGTDEVMVLALEHDQWNGANEFMGIGPAWVTAGDWLTGTPYPLFNVEDPDRGVFTDYMMTFYPLIYRICPNGIVERVFTSQTEAQLYQMVQDCQALLSMEDLVVPIDVRFDPLSRNLVIERFKEVQSLTIIDPQGRVVQRMGPLTDPAVPLIDLSSGIYVYQITKDQGALAGRFLIEQR